MTGAPMPPGLDQVVVIERASVCGDLVRFDEGPAAKRHVRARVSDFNKGQVLLAAGRMLDPRAMVVAATADMGAVTVWRQPRVACVSGDELAQPGWAATTRFAIPDSLTEAMMLMGRQWGGKPGVSHRLRDTPADLTAAAASTLEDCDVLVLLGGATRGDRDFAKLALEPLGFEMAFADVAIKPGEPVWYGRLGAVHVVGFPGKAIFRCTALSAFHSTRRWHACMLTPARCGSPMVPTRCTTWLWVVMS